MSRGHQIVVATGHLGADPVTKAFQTGGLVAELSIAVSEAYKDRDGQPVEHTEWLRAKVFGRGAEIAQQYLRKGRLITIEGKLHTEKWQDSEGHNRYSTWIYVDPRGLTMHGGQEHTHTRKEHEGRAPAEPAAPEFPTDEELRDELPF